jgi:hypothetical protein
MLRVSIAAAFVIATLPAFAMDGCAPGKMSISKAPAEANEQTAEAKSTPVTERMKAESVRTAATRDEEKKVQ